MFVSFLLLKIIKLSILKIFNYSCRSLLSEFSPIQFPDTVYVKYELITKCCIINFFYLNSNKKQPISFNPFTVCVIDEDLGYFKKIKNIF